MNKSLKLITAVLLITVMSLALFAGCSSDNGNTSTGSSTNAQTTTQPKDEPVTILWYTITDDATNKNYKWPQVVEAFEDKNPGIKVDLKPLISSNNNADYYKKVDLMLASGEPIDFIEFANMSFVSQKVKADVLEPLNAYAEKEGIVLEDEYRGIQKIDGKNYTISNSYSMWLVFLNKDMLDAAGLPVPPNDWTWDDYREYAKKLTKGEGRDKVYGSYFHTWEWFNAIGYMNAVENTPWYKPDGSANFDDPVFKEFMQLRYEMENVDKSQMPLMDIKTQKTNFRNVFFSGKTAMMPQGSWMLGDIKRTEQYPRDFKVTFATFPRASESSKTNFTANGNAGAGYAINKSSKHKEETYKFIRFLTTEGINISKAYFSPWKKADKSSLAKDLCGDDLNLYELDQFTKVVLDPNAASNVYTNKPAYDSEVISIFNEESEKYFLGGQSVDEAIANMQKRANAVIQKAK